MRKFILIHHIAKEEKNSIVYQGNIVHQASIVHVMNDYKIH